MAKWTEDTTYKFVQEYLKHECLYNCKAPTYKIKGARDTALVRISEAMNIPWFGSKEVYTKIRNLRSTYAQEAKKIKHSTKSGAGTDDVYIPQIKWFKLLDDALKAVNVQCSDSGSNLQLDGESAEINNPDATPESQSNQVEGQRKSPIPRKRTVRDLSRLVNKVKNVADSINTRMPTETETEFDIFGKSVAAQLKSLPIQKAVEGQMFIQNYISHLRLQQMDHGTSNYAYSPSPNSMYHSSPSPTNTLPPRDSPYTQPPRYSLYSQTPRDSPYTQPPRHSPYTQTPRDSPYTQPPRDSPYSQTPRDSPNTQTPRDSPYTPPPRDSPYSQTPRDSPNTQTPRDSPYAQTPRDSPYTQPPRDSPNTQTPRDSPYKQTPRDSPYTQPPRHSLYSQTPRDSPYSQTPRDSPYAQTPRDSPYTQPPRDSPNTQTPRDSPYKQTPRDSPYTQPPRHSHYSQTPRDSPYSQTPRDSPYAQTPRDSPYTQPPRHSPYTQTPRDSPYTQPPQSSTPDPTSTNDIHKISDAHLSLNENTITIYSENNASQMSIADPDDILARAVSSIYQ